MSIDLTALDLASMKTVELRKIAAQAGVKGMSSARKGQLLEVLAPMKAEQDRAAKLEEQSAETAKKAQAQARADSKGKARKTCVICKTRPGMTASQLQFLGLGRDYADQCQPCHVEAEWENAHSDRNHEAFNAETWVPETTERVVDLIEETKDCWICHPELNEAAKTYAPRSGSSKAGMKIHAKGSVRDKIEVVKRAAMERGLSMAIEETGGQYTAKINGLQLSWDASGRYDYAGSSWANGGKVTKVRNVSEALRILSQMVTS
jgi:ribosomal protein S14